MTETMDDFQAYLDKHPKALDSMERKEELEYFKEQYHVDKRSKFYCPVCSEYMKLGRLFQSVDDPNVYVCKNCLVVVRVEIISIPQE